jgi:hypothetical protein
MELVAQIYYLVANCHAVLSSLIVGILQYCNMKPEMFARFFPPSVDPTRVMGMIDDNIFPSALKLSDAILYAIYLSLARMVLHRFFFKVFHSYQHRRRWTNIEPKYR